MKRVGGAPAYSSRSIVAGIGERTREEGEKREIPAGSGGEGASVHKAAYRRWLEDSSTTTIFIYSALIVTLIPAFHFTAAAIPGIPPDSLTLRLVAAGVSACVALSLLFFRGLRHYSPELQLANVLPTLIVFPALVVDSGNSPTYVMGNIVLAVGMQPAFHRVRDIIIATVATCSFEAVYSMMRGVFFEPSNINALANTSAAFLIAMIFGIRRIQIQRDERERTYELSDANAKLATTLDDLKHMQVQLVQNEKMAGIGTLTAGIAHEINNPANFAHLGAQELSTNLERFRQLLLELAGPEAAPDVLAEINARVDQLNGQAETITEGTTRIRDLVTDLRTFSRLDEAERKSVRVGDSLQSTLNLVRTQYKDTAEIISDLAANPKLECWPALLNQVFMNLVVNACQAIATQRQRSGSDEYHGRLTICSRIEGEKFVMEFTDNGCGISEASIGHIFDPFFTTKGVGEGTGLGLSISFGIVEKHGGTLTVRSVEGDGACFTLRLPMQGGEE